VAACILKSDEAVLRDEFGLSSGVTLAEMDVSPKQSGWFGREGLTINARFIFSDKQFADYLKAAEQNPLWKPMPPQKAFLMKMLGVRRHAEGVKLSYQMTGRDLPPEGSIYNPTEDQLYDRQVKRLPLHVSRGLYQCKTAGDNLMHNRKVPCDSKEGDLNDFMFAVLDPEKKELLIRVRTSY
jgi:hypothetical protein